MKFVTRPIDDAPATKSARVDKYAEVLKALAALPSGQALVLQPEGKETVRGLKSGLSRRIRELGLELETRADERSLWVWSKSVAEPGPGPLGAGSRGQSANGAAP